MDLDSLYLLVTEAILRAEVLEELGAPGAPTAYLDVSLLEEKIADILPASESEGAIARRGAVRAALAAGDAARARRLAERFGAEAAASAQLREELNAMAVASTDTPSPRDRLQAARYPHVSKTPGLDEVHRVAQAFIRQGAPFPIG